MRVYLAAQVTSKTACRLIDDSVNFGKHSKETLAPMRELLSCVDRLIDIMNATSKDDADFVNCERINSPRHPLLGELLNILNVFTVWKEQAGIFTTQFITRESFEDLNWMILSIIGASSHYLDINKSKTLAQDRSNSDDCEHHFCNIRIRNSSASVQNCEHWAAHAQAVRSSTFKIKGKGNTSDTRKETID